MESCDIKCRKMKLMLKKMHLIFNKYYCLEIIVEAAFFSSNSNYRK